MGSFYISKVPVTNRVFALFLNSIDAGRKDLIDNNSLMVRQKPNGLWEPVDGFDDESALLNTKRL